MSTYHLFTRTQYAEPLQRQAVVELEGAPALEDLPVEGRGDWLEVVLIPDEKVTWVLRDGDLITGIDAPEVTT